MLDRLHLNLVSFFVYCAVYFYLPSFFWFKLSDWSCLYSCFECFLVSCLDWYCSFYLFSFILFPRCLPIRQCRAWTISWKQNWNIFFNRTLGTWWLKIYYVQIAHTKNIWNIKISCQSTTSMALNEISVDLNFVISFCSNHKNIGRFS